MGRALERAIDKRSTPILLTSRGTRMDRHCATRRLRRLAELGGVKLRRMHPHLLRHTFVTTMLDAGVHLRDVQIAARHADPHTTMRNDRAAGTSTEPQLHPCRLHNVRNLTAVRSCRCERALSDHEQFDESGHEADQRAGPEGAENGPLGSEEQQGRERRDSE